MICTNPSDNAIKANPCKKNTENNVFCATLILVHRRNDYDLNPICSWKVPFKILLKDE